MAEDTYYESRFGGLRLWISKLRTDKSRTQVRHELSAGDDYVVQDRGRALMVTTATLLFDWMDGDNLSPLERIRALAKMADDQPRIFVHPVEGSFNARVGPFTYELDENTVISAEIEFTPVSEVETTALASTGSLLGAGVGICSAARDELLAQLEDSGIDSDLPDLAADTVAAWDDDASTRQILADTGSLTAQFGDAADSYDNDIGLWSAFKATVVMAEAVRVTADAALAGAPTTFLARVGTPIALRALLQSTYPADQADVYYDMVMQLNDIATPWSIDMDTQLVMPLPAPLPRAA